MKNLPDKHLRSTQSFFITFSALAVAMLLWAVLFEIDIVSNAEGQVIPVGR